MADDLTAKAASPTRRTGRRLPRISFLSAATVVVAVAAAALGGYLLIAEDPLGGEPVARVKVAVSSPAGGGDDEPRQDAASAMRSSLDPDMQDDGRPLPDTIGAGLVIRDPESLSVVGGPSAGSDMVVPALVESSPYGPLPTVAPDGLRPAVAYGRAGAAPAGGKPRIAIVVTGMGLSTTATESAIAELPADVTFAFAPYGREVERLVARARQDGHEIMLQVPLEPYDYPDNDPGPHTLLTGLSAEQNRDRLHWVMSRFGGYVGVTNYMGGRFTASEETLRPVLGELRDRGLVYADDGSSTRSLAPDIARDIALPFAQADLMIDAEPDRESVRAALEELRERAMGEGLAIGMASGLPASIEEIARWSSSLEEAGIQLVPITAAVSGGET